jgi:uncharacterized protein (DUF2147 family)
MFSRTVLLVFAAALLMSAAPLHGAEGDEVLGIWFTEDKEAKIEIFTCGPRYCGRIYWMQEPDFPADDEKGMAGLPKTDRNNPDPKLRARLLQGLKIIEDFYYVGDNRYKGGKIYNPEDGKFYRAKMKLASKSRLKMRGFVGLSVFGQTQTWTRDGGSPGNLQHASTPEDQARF